MNRSTQSAAAAAGWASGRGISPATAQRFAVALMVAIRYRQIQRKKENAR